MNALLKVVHAASFSVSAFKWNPQYSGEPGLRRPIDAQRMHMYTQGSLGYMWRMHTAQNMFQGRKNKTEYFRSLFFSSLDQSARGTEVNYCHHDDDTKSPGLINTQ
jgi:hypothetical protein